MNEQLRLFETTRGCWEPIISETINDILHGKDYSYAYVSKELVEGLCERLAKHVGIDHSDLCEDESFLWINESILKYCNDHINNNPKLQMIIDVVNQLNQLPLS